MDLSLELGRVLGSVGAPANSASGAERKNYTERLSQEFTELIARRLQELGLTQVRAPHGRDKQFMGGYGTKGVDVYLSDEKHGLRITPVAVTGLKALETTASRACAADSP